MGAPFLSRNEARARLDLPAIEGGDELIVPLNVLEGGLASPRDTDPTRERYNADGTARRVKTLPAKSEDEKKRKASGKPNEEDKAEITAVYTRFFERQAKSILPKIGAGSEWWDEERWNRELTDDLLEVAMTVSEAAALQALKDLFDDGEYDMDRTKAFIRKMCERRAEMVNQTTYKQLEEALEADEDDEAMKATPEGVFENAKENRSGSAGAAFACALCAWSLLETCRQNERGQNVYKTWLTTSGNPRASHAHMNGETVKYDEPFSNGAMWPGDIDNLSVEEVAGCQCIIEITIED